ncbi:F-box/FBD/LRR-repeat protein At3g52680-like isoform X1 [Fagus crenata]
MSFKLCSGLKSIKFLDLPKLRAIEVKDNRHLERVELESSNLYNVVIEQTATPCEINLVHCKNIKELNLRAHITDKWLHDHLSELPLIEILSLVVCSKLERIKISSHHLKSLELLACANLVEVKIDAPNLCRLWYYYKTIISFSMNGLALSEAIYHSMSGIVPWNVERIEFLSKLSNSKVLKLMFPSNERGIIPKELRETVSSPSYNVKHLHLYQPSSALSYTRHEINELMDSLLWISPLLDILTIECSCKGFPDFYKITFKFSYEKPSYKGDNPSCCKFLPFPCWRHCLKTVKIDNFRGFADREILHKYFFENAKSLEDFQFYDGAIA